VSRITRRQRAVSSINKINSCCDKLRRGHFDKRGLRADALPITKKCEISIYGSYFIYEINILSCRMIYIV